MLVFNFTLIHVRSVSAADRIMFNEEESVVNTVHEGVQEILKTLPAMLLRYSLYTKALSFACHLGVTYYKPDSNFKLHLQHLIN